MASPRCSERGTQPLLDTDGALRTGPDGLPATGPAYGGHVRGDWGDPATGGVAEGNYSVMLIRRGEDLIMAVVGTRTYDSRGKLVHPETLDISRAKILGPAPRPRRGRRRGRRRVHPAAGGRAARSVAARRAQPSPTASRALARCLRPGTRVHRRPATRPGPAHPDRHHRRAHRHSGDRARRVRAVPHRTAGRPARGSRPAPARTGSARSVPLVCAPWRQPCSGRASPWEHSTSSPSPPPNVTTPSTSRR